jgi:hypothetical protein
MRARRAQTFAFRNRRLELLSKFGAFGVGVSKSARLLLPDEVLIDRPVRDRQHATAMGTIGRQTSRRRISQHELSALRASESDIGDHAGSMAERFLHGSRPPPNRFLLFQPSSHAPKAAVSP